MYLATIDCGTTNSRVYIHDEHGHIIGKATQKVGVRDTAITGQKETLKIGLKETFIEAVSLAGVNLDEVKLILSSGMITSEIGLIEIPHLWAPAGLEDLARNMVKVQEHSVFPVGIPIYFVRGIKNRYDPATISMKEVGWLDFMRGEETQVAGLLSDPTFTLPATVVFLSSHTKFVPIDQNRMILGSLTTLSGQVFEALTKETSIGKSIKSDDDFQEQDYMDFEVIEIAQKWVDNSGFLRSLMMCRFMDTLLSTKWYQRKLFVDAVIAAEDLHVLSQFEKLQFPLDTDFILCGLSRRCQIFEYVLRHRLAAGKTVRIVDENSGLDSLSIKGSIHLAFLAQLL